MLDIYSTLEISNILKEIRPYSYSELAKERFDSLKMYTNSSLLKEDLAKAEKHVNSYDKKYHWTQNEYDALVSFAYNVGNIHQLTAFGTRSKTTIANKILQYTKSNGTVLQGLVRRRNKEQKLFLTPVSVSYETIAKEVIAGKWGNGSARRKALIKAGYDATLVQQLVNEMLR